METITSGMKQDILDAFAGLKDTPNNRQTLENHSLGSHPCPNCGYCPHCGRGGYRTYPYYHPWGVVPYYGSPYYGSGGTYVENDNTYRPEFTFTSTFKMDSNS